MEDGKDGLPLGVSDGSQSVPGYSTRHQTWHIRNDEAQRSATSTADHAPKPRRRLIGAVLRHALVPHHLLKDILELRILRLLARVGAVAVARLVREEVPRPRVGVLASGLRGDLLVDVLEGVVGCEVVGVGVGEEAALGVVVASAGGVGEGVVGVVDELELASSFGAFWGLGGDSVGVCFQSSSRRRLTMAVHICLHGRGLGGVFLHPRSHRR